MSDRAFQDLETAGWNEVAGDYASSPAVTAIARSAARALADAVDAGTGDRLLDLACGPGYAAAEAQARGAGAVAVDISEAMTQIAAVNAPGAELHVAPADDLPLPSDSVDGVMCGFGLPHFEAPEAVFAETFRVTRPGGRIAFTTWCRPEEVPFFGIVFTAVAEHGSLDVPLPEGPDMFRFADGAEVDATLTGTGFVDVSTERLPLVASVEQSSDAMDLVTRATVRTRALYEAQEPEAKTAIARHVARSIEELRGDRDAISVAMPAVLITATVPAA